VDPGLSGAGGFVEGGWWSDSVDLRIKVPSLLAGMYVAMVAERASAISGLDGDMHTHLHRADDVRHTRQPLATAAGHSTRLR
jgi:hypothetical protein